MSKGTTLILLTLSVLASFLLGINVGKKLNPILNCPSPSPTPIILPSATPTASLLPPSPLPTTATGSAIQSSSQVQGVSVYNDATCGFSVTYPSHYVSKRSANGEGVILSDPSDGTKSLAFTCAESIPRPPVSAENIEPVLLDGVAGSIYHDKDNEGLKRDIVIVKNAAKKAEIIIVGDPAVLNQSLRTFKFL